MIQDKTAHYSDESRKINRGQENKTGEIIFWAEAPQFTSIALISWL